MKKNKKLLITMLVVYLVVLLFLLILIFPSAMVVIRDYVFYKMSPDLLIIVFAALIMFIIMLVFMIFNVYSRIEKTDKKKNATNINISLDDERSYLERQINDLNEKLVSNDERWEEVYHLILTSQNRQNERTGLVSLSKFLSGFGIDYANIKVQNDLVFVLTPFHEDFMNTYKVVSETCSKIKLISMRGDEEFVPNDVLQHIIKCIVKSRVVVANLNGRNPNVFYELGIAHTLNKPTILLAHRDTQIPFDLQNQYLVLYRDEDELRHRLTDALLKIMTLNI